MTIHQMDVKTAYLNARIDCEIYMEHTDGFVEKDKNGETLVYRLFQTVE